MATITQPTDVRVRDWAGIRARRIVDVQGPASYTNPGGDPVTAGQFGLGEFEVFPQCIALDASNATPRLVVFSRGAIPGTGVLRYYVPNTGAEVANTTDLSGHTFRVEVAGRG